MDKKELQALFSKEWEKHYKIPFFEEYDFKRKKCSCGKTFWTLDEERTECGEPHHSGYTFVGEPIGKFLSYKETWREMADFYRKYNHEILDRYPVVARWRDDLFFTIASIAVFQPYVVRGEADPPANPLLIPQPSLRFKDIQNVGITGRHFTSFVMVGQHAFNKEKTTVWKDEAVRQIFEYMTKEVGIPEDKIVFHEDVWMGGGNFGPSLEYFVEGLELGNIVFMQYEFSGGGYKELPIKVLDHGIGLSRFAWIRSGEPVSYRVVFPKTTDYLERMVDIHISKEGLKEIVKVAGFVDVEEDPNSIKELESRFPELWKDYLKLSMVYAISDHLYTLLLAAHDGAYPSNVRGGHNLRILLRRVFSFEKKMETELDYGRILSLLSEDSLFPELYESVNTLLEIISLERKRYEESKERGAKKVLVLAKKGYLTKDDLKLLYESYGITPEDAKSITNVPMEEISFYEELETPRPKKKKDTLPDVSDLPKTEPLYYKDPYMVEFQAKVLDIRDGWVILDKTAFYPEGGGQESDRGWINNSKVTDVQKKNGVILHKVEENPPKVGEIIRGKIDWKRRYRLMKHHTATHIVLAATRRVLKHMVWQEGAHKGEDEAHIDISFYRPLSPEEVKEIEREANRIVMENRNVIIKWMKRAEAEKHYGITIYQGGAVPGGTLRIVEIEGVDVEACGGTHVKKTGEIGFIKIVSRKSIADGVERLTYKAGEASIEYVQHITDILRETSQNLRVGIDQLPSSTKRLLEEVKEGEKEKSRLKRQIAELLKEKIGSGMLIVNSIDVETANYVYEAYGKPLIVVSKEGKPNIMIFGKKDIIDTLKRLGAKGGGKGDRAYFTVDDPLKLLEQLKKLL